MEKVLNIAKAEVGYLEKKSPTQLDDKTANAGDKNYTKYWRDLCPALQTNPWCACFVAWCFEKAYGKSMALKLLCAKNGYTYYTPTMANYFKTAGRFYKNNPRIGDIIFFSNNVRIAHVGIVRDVDSQYVYTIEGNTSSSAGVIPNGGAVCLKKYPLAYKRIVGYGRPDYPKPLLKKGDKGEEVKWLQRKLNEFGYNLKVDGDFGNLTYNALINFQERHNLEVDGVCGKNTRNKLLSVN